MLSKSTNNRLLSLTKSKDFLVVYLQFCDFVSLKKNDTRLTPDQTSGLPNARIGQFLHYKQAQIRVKNPIWNNEPPQVKRRFSVAIKLNVKLTAKNGEKRMSLF